VESGVFRDFGEPRLGRDRVDHDAGDLGGRRAGGTYALSPTATSATSSASGQATYGVTTGTSGGTFSDAFNRADSTAVANGWTAVSGSYGIQSGMAVAQAAPGFAIQAGVNGQAVSARADFVRPASTSGTMFGVVVRYRDAKNYYACYRGRAGRRSSRSRRSSTALRPC
jgi:hypothetical protein